ncbi:hypothetical protein SAMN05880501_11430 [Ureibacillus xyleni]|uniref:Uncharacterized protein n=1 Tax=Ureibacillus xyleni TaxID=614648 RepID=A0A285TP96_9BACL|nr:hypothetical protein SAMN05880501_11430 [Ureibacillus xyleni]
MYLRGVTRLGAVIVLGIASIVGTILYKKSKSIRIAHILLIVITLFTVFLYILFS